MYAYLDIKAELQREADNGVAERARQSEASRQSIELQAWADRDLRKRG